MGRVSIAGQESEQITRARLREATGWVSVTAKQFPVLWEALDAISHDCGAGAGHENYAIPEQLADALPKIEAALATLTEDERAEFAIGDQYLADQLAARSEDLKLAHDFLNAFFDDWNVQ